MRLLRVLLAVFGVAVLALAGVMIWSGVEWEFTAAAIASGAVPLAASLVGPSHRLWNPLLGLSALAAFYIANLVYLIGNIN